MLRLVLAVILGVTLQLASRTHAALIVNSARPVTHQVTVQIIQTALDDGTSPAAVFGDSARQIAIEKAIDTIWAQAGIDIRFLSTVVRYNNTFAYQGLGGLRPLQDLSAIMGSAQLDGGVLNPDPAVINMFFVGITPGFNLKDATWANGVGNIGANGIAVFIGANVSAEHAAHWVSHEIAHNLGLEHSATGVRNLMATTRNSELLSDDQIAAIFQTEARSDAVAIIPSGGTGFPKPLMLQTPGDYDRNGIVETADYAIWRKWLGTTVNLAADGNLNGIVDQQDYHIWRANYGRGFIAGSSADQSFGPATVPEPAAVVYWVIAAWVIAAGEATRQRIRLAHNSPSPQIGKRVLSPPSHPLRLN